MVGKKFDRLTVQSLDRIDKSVYYVCLCDCGKTTRVLKGNLTGGRQRSCGCLRSEKAREWAEARRKQATCHPDKRHEAHGLCKLCVAKRERELKPELNRARQRRYEASHREKRNFYDSKRRAAKHLAMPIWADKHAIATKYAEAKQMSQLCGQIYCVDHIVPLRSAVVCGLHVPWNLQVISKVENTKKGNKLLL